MKSKNKSIPEKGHKKDPEADWEADEETGRQSCGQINKIMNLLNAWRLALIEIRNKTEMQGKRRQTT